MICHDSLQEVEGRGESVGESILYQIREEYLQAKPPLQIKGLQEKVQACNSDSNRIISHNLRSLYEITVGQATKCQPPVQYRIAFVKRVIKQLESDKPTTTSDDEYDEDENASLWYEALQSLCSLKEQSEPFYRLYEISGNKDNNGDNIIVKIFEHEGAFAAEGTTGLVTWEASIQLSKWLNSQTQEIKNFRWIVELGCGSGFLAVVVCKIFPHLSKYIASDGHFKAVEKCKVNLDANFETLKTDDVIQTEQIDWQKDGEKFKDIVRNLTTTLGPGILFGADIVFDPSVIPSILGLIDIFMESHNLSNAYLSCTIRNETTMEILKTQLRDKSNIRISEAHSWENGVVLKIQNIFP